MTRVRVQLVPKNLFDFSKRSYDFSIFKSLVLYQNNTLNLLHLLGVGWHKVINV